MLGALRDHRADELYGLEILARLGKAGWLKSLREDEDPREEGQPRRRFDQLNRYSAERAKVLLEETDKRTQALRPLRTSVGSGMPL